MRKFLNHRVFLSAATATLAFGPSDERLYAQVKADADVVSYESSDPVEIGIGINLTIDPGWHINWRNSGASGTATKLAWTLPPACSLAHLHWPTPEKFPVQTEALATYGYEDEVTLTANLLCDATRLAPTASALAKISWLACSESACTPGSKDLRIALESFEPTATATQQKTRPVLIEIKESAGVARLSGGNLFLAIDHDRFPAVVSQNLYLFPELSNTFHHRFAQKWTRVGPVMQAKLDLVEGAYMPTEVRGVLVDHDSNQSFGISLKVTHAHPLLLSIAALAIGFLFNFFPWILPLIVARCTSRYAGQRSNTQENFYFLVGVLSAAVAITAWNWVFIDRELYSYAVPFVMDKIGFQVLFACATFFLGLAFLNFSGMETTLLGWRSTYLYAKRHSAAAGAFLLCFSALPGFSVIYKLGWWPQIGSHMLLAWCTILFAMGFSIPSFLLSRFAQNLYERITFPGFSSASSSTSFFFNIDFSFVAHQSGRSFCSTPLDLSC